MKNQIFFIILRLTETNSFAQIKRGESTTEWRKAFETRKSARGRARDEPPARISQIRLTLFGKKLVGLLKMVTVEGYSTPGLFSNCEIRMFMVESVFCVVTVGKQLLRVIPHRAT